MVELELKWIIYKIGTSPVRFTVDEHLDRGLVEVQYNGVLIIDDNAPCAWLEADLPRVVPVHESDGYLAVEANVARHSINTNGLGRVVFDGFEHNWIRRWDLTRHQREPVHWQGSTGSEPRRKPATKFM